MLRTVPLGYRRRLGSYHCGLLHICAISHKLLQHSGVFMRRRIRLRIGASCCVRLPHRILRRFRDIALHGVLEMFVGGHQVMPHGHCRCVARQCLSVPASRRMQSFCAVRCVTVRLLSARTIKDEGNRVRTADVGMSAQTGSGATGAPRGNAQSNTLGSKADDDRTWLSKQFLVSGH